MEWPEIDLSTGDYATESTIRLVLQRAAEASIADITEDHAKMRPLVRKFKQTLADADGNWSQQYRKVFEEFVQVMAAATSNEQALDMAQAGIDTLQDELIYRLDLHTIVPVKDIFVLTNSFVKLETVDYVGTKPLQGFSLDESHPFPFKFINPCPPTDANPEELAAKQLQEDPSVEADIQEGQHVLHGHDACAQVDAFFRYGFMENSASVLAKSTFMTPDLTSLTSNKVFVLLGVTSELGPAKSLLQIEGCTVLGICRGDSGDAASAKRMQELIDFVTFHAPDNTTLKCVKGGADLLTQGPQIIQWILDNTKESQEIVVCPLATTSVGEEALRVAVAMDCIVQRISRQRRKTIVCQYISPASIMVLPPAASTMAEQRLASRPTIEKWASSYTRWCESSVVSVNNDYCIINGIVTALGPEYSMAKLLQQWRCMLTYYRDHRIVATPFAPPTKTASTIPAVAAALEGIHYFEPLIALPTASASTLMAAVMLSQIQFMNRPLPDMDENPFTIFWDGAVHGGVWTCPYTLESISTINWVLGKAWYAPSSSTNNSSTNDDDGENGGGATTMTMMTATIPEKARVPKKVEATNDENGDNATAKGQPPKDKMERAIEILEAGSEYGKPMPDCVKERLEFLY
eukprot:CAMPEP_0119547382 /NCGR_PEP_ID=MMETSP1352-20130426/1513_1 /TAXON_ID=265584 /ORGANISM="Stauroneis constricta, Strain CCMP1120" /LENGTH=633 /DNA_ID=CAMNT_0007592291 /DNA_START=83 /DNA_END=1982 /DNA_ORIENTATION=+